MSGMTDWDAWHQPYEQPDSPLSRRLRIIQEHIRAWMDETAPLPVTVVSSCAGDGRDLLQVLADRPDAHRVTATLLEYDARNVARAREAIGRAGLREVTVTCVDAGTTDAYVGAVPADLVLLCGVFGNVSDDDVHRTVRALPQLCAPGALVVWTRHRGAPDLTPQIRTWLEDQGFDEVGFTAPDDVLFAVGAHRFHGMPAALKPGQRLFTFTR